MEDIISFYKITLSVAVKFDSKISKAKYTMQLDNTEMLYCENWGYFFKQT